MNYSSCLKSLASIALLYLSTISSHAAAIWYLQGDQTTAQNYNSFTTWFSSPSGGTAATAMNSSDIYSTNGHLVRTTNVAGTSTFSGGTLQIAGGILALKSITSNISTILVTTTGGTIENAGPAGAGGQATLNTTNLTVNGATLITDLTQVALTVNISTVSGAGAITLAGSGTTTLGFSSLSAYTGLLSLTGQTQLSFTTGFTSNGGFSINSSSGAQLVGLNTTIGFTSLSINGSALGTGNYTYQNLKTLYPTIFTSATSSGMISVVPEPSSCSLALLFVGASLALSRMRHKLRKGSSR